MDMPELEDIIELNETVEINHRQYLLEFDEKVWPIFEQRGYSKDTALLFWLLNRMENKLDTLIKVATDNAEDERDGWW